jgi:hypothetical protein
MATIVEVDGVKLAVRSRMELALANKVFTGNGLAAGVVLPIYSGTTQQFGLWNPAGSGWLGEIFEVGLGSYIDQTAAAGGFVLGILKNAPAQLATGASITAFTETTPESSIPNVVAGNKIKFGVGATLTVTAPAVWKHLNLVQDAFNPTAAVSQAQEKGVVKFPERTIWLPPGCAIFLAGNIATLIKCAPTITWGEHAWPLKQAAVAS